MHWCPVYWSGSKIFQVRGGRGDRVRWRAHQNGLPPKYRNLKIGTYLKTRNTSIATKEKLLWGAVQSIFHKIHNVNPPLIYSPFCNVAPQSKLCNDFFFVSRGRGGTTGRSGFTTPPEPRRKTTRGDKSGDSGDADATPDAEADA